MPRPKRKKAAPEPDRPLDDRAWSARSNMHARDAASKDLVRFTPLPAETCPTWAPDRLSVWPVEGGRFGLDAHYHRATRAHRAAHQVTRLADAGLHATLRDEPEDGTTLRLGPLAHQAAWLA